MARSSTGTFHVVILVQDLMSRKLEIHRTHASSNQHKESGVCANIGASFLPLAFETFGKISDETMSLIRDLVRDQSIILFAFAVSLEKKICNCLTEGKCRAYF